MIFAKMIQTKLNYKKAGIRFKQGTEFKYAKMDIFGVENKIHHDFLDPRNL